MTDIPLFYIEMGQGIIASGDLRVCTSALFSCTFIAGHNAGGYGGAYHYPANSLEETETKRDMELWADKLQPNVVTLVFSGADPPLGTSESDKKNLRNWVFTMCKCEPNIERAVAAGMELVGTQFYAGDTKDKGFYPDEAIPAKKWDDKAHKILWKCI